MDLQRDADQFRALSVQVVAVMTDPLDSLRGEATRRGLSRVPILSDAQGQVSRAYGTLEGTMHPGVKPGHTFVLIDRAGNILWQRDYPEMYAPDEDILRETNKALAG